MSPRARSRSAGRLLGTLVALAVAVAVWWFTSDPTEAGQTPSAPLPADPATAVTVLDGLTVAEEDTGFRYDRDQWPHWSSQGEGCNTREVALRQQGTDVVTDDECRAVSGTWVSDYDGLVLHDASEADLDHLVPLAEAARSGTRKWTRDQRAAFANDLDQLVVVSATSNRQKGDQDPASWLPDQDRCAYAIRWVLTKDRYDLTVDRDERDALRGVLTHCPRS
ncbi:HNH endonuclease family protein [Actinophytocola glycyrrhizae]|uniref:HNH endonuclease family protein n=1 Tax=Actinophytocola glycyrrhizae TaxID=2044873 RepID=A0ABV9RUN0_9PSEU